MLTWVAPLNAWRRCRESTGGTVNPRYCYSVWLRHLVILAKFGFVIKGAHICELGPGDSVGVGIATLLSGAELYTVLDIRSYSVRTDHESILEELVELFRRKEPIPDSPEFPRIRPRLESYQFPKHLIKCDEFDNKVDRIRSEIKKGCAPAT
jgi:hypothetical protein